MSSALSVPARDDVWITTCCPSWDADHLAGPYELWKMLLTTSAAASSSQAKDLYDLADHCLYFARIYRLLPSERNSGHCYANVHQTIIKHAPSPWTLAQCSWTPPTPPPSLNTPVGQLDLDSVARDLQQRMTQSLRIPYPSGRLWQYAIAHVAYDQCSTKYRAYLFDSLIYFVSEVRSPLWPIVSVNERSTPLEVAACIDLNDVAQLRLVFTGRSGMLPLEIELDVRQGSQRKRVTLGFSSPAELVSWENTLRTLLEARGRMAVTPSATTDAVNALHHVTDWRGASGKLGAFMAHTIVAICGGMADPTPIARVGVYLFATALVVLYTDRDDQNHLVQLAACIDLFRVQRLALCGRGNTLCVSICETERAGNDRGSLVRKNYYFEFDNATEATAWLNSIREHTPPASGELFAPPAPFGSGGSTEHWSLAGVVFLAPSTSGAENEYNIGVGLLPLFQSAGLASHAVAHALGVAFDTLGAHRVLARILNGDTAGASVRKFVQLGFSHEGVRRRAAMHPAERCWVDVSELAVLDSDWAVRHSVPKRAPSLWDEMFARHQREHEQMLRWEARGLKRTKSMETVRDQRALEDAAPTPSMVGNGSVAEDAAQAPDPPPVTSASVSAAVASPPPPSQSDTASSWDAVDDLSDVEPLPDKMERWTATTRLAAEDGGSDTESWGDLDMKTDDEAGNPPSAEVRGENVAMKT
ncbi:hypothetical protein AURDEDRAFT_188440 [Auricularia subglabra TFB-10046 SS5]|uniref:Uncharacterized protein n=1 Tax=Auricularia subglabra (strain TFB-10046 / SS5) TaxID=717982 RepID=J0WU53_AURST|nr:hypothetical protein AURDEDRAFT_188440 [Auricularia subglabra TFB-10046 SS5]